MKKWQIENSEKLKVWEKLFRVFLFPSFRFCPTAKIENSDLKISKKNLRDFRDFRGFRVFDLAHENSKKWRRCEKLLSENNFEAVLATFCCYKYGANASEAVQNIATDQKDYHKCSSCVIVC